MKRLSVALVLGWGALALLRTSAAQSGQFDSTASAVRPILPADESALPPPPRGKSTILGGEIRDVDPVRDVLTLKAFGEKPMKILFDERTHIYLDGGKIPLRELHPSEHASIQTTLDGSNVFALSVHILSTTPEGDYEGRIVSFDPVSNELEIDAPMSAVPFRLVVSGTTSITREGQAGFSSAQSGRSDLVKGSLVSVTFQSGKQGQGVASEIKILAVPGAQFLFNGNLASFDLHSGTLTLVDPRDKKSYEIKFDPNRIPASQSLHPGQDVRVSAAFDGIHYTATWISVTHPGAIPSN